MPAILKKEDSHSSIVFEPPIAAANGSPIVQVKNIIDKKIRNLEKRKSKLDQYKSDLKDGKVLIDEQLKAVQRSDEVEQQLELIKDVQKNVSQVFQEHKRQQKLFKQAEHRDQCESEMSKIRQLLTMQEILDALGKDNIRQQFVSGTNGTVKLTEEELSIMDEIYSKICPTRDDLTDGQSWSMSLQESSQFVHYLLNCSSKIVPGKKTTFKELRALIDKVATCEYFNNKISRCQSPEQAKSETSSVTNDDCNVATLRLDEMAPTKRQLQNFSSQNECNNSNSTLHSLLSPLPQIFSPSQPSSHPAVIFIQNDQTGALCNRNYFIPPHDVASPTFHPSATDMMKLMNFVAPVEPTTAFTVPHHSVPQTNADVMNANHLAYCSNGQESLAFIYAQQPPYVTIPAAAFVDTYAHGYPNMTSMEHHGQTVPPHFMPSSYSSTSSKSLDPNAPSFVSRSINWIPVMWPNHTIHQEISSDDANQTYDALQGIVEIGQKVDQLTDGSYATGVNGMAEAIETNTTATMNNSGESIPYSEEEIGDPSLEMAIEGFNEMNLSGEMLDNNLAVTNLFGQMPPATMFEPDFSQPSHHLQPFWYNYGLQTFGPPCI